MLAEHGNDSIRTKEEDSVKRDFSKATLTP